MWLLCDSLSTLEAKLRPAEDKNNHIFKKKKKEKKYYKFMYKLAMTACVFSVLPSGFCRGFEAAQIMRWQWAAVIRHFKYFISNNNKKKKLTRCNFSPCLDWNLPILWSRNVHHVQLREKKITQDMRKFSRTGNFTDDSKVSPRRLSRSAQAESDDYRALPASVKLCLIG